MSIIGIQEAARREALGVAAAMGSGLAYTLVDAREEAQAGSLRRVRMRFEKGNGKFRPSVVVEVYPESGKRPRALLMYVEIVPSCGRPNRFVDDKSIGARLIKGANRCWNVTPTKEDRTRFNLRACVLRNIEESAHG